LYPGEGDVKNPIKDIAYLQKLMEKGYVLEGPRQNPSKDLLVLKRFLRRGHGFVPEDWLKSRGYEFVEPSSYTKGFKLAYMIKDGVLVQYFRSNYSLYRNDRKIFLYLREEEKAVT
jgi:hypothetical protein